MHRVQAHLPACPCFTRHQPLSPQPASQPASQPTASPSRIQPCCHPSQRQALRQALQLLPVSNILRPRLAHTRGRGVLRQVTHAQLRPLTPGAGGGDRQRRAAQSAGRASARLYCSSGVVGMTVLRQWCGPTCKHKLSRHRSSRRTNLSAAPLPTLTEQGCCCCWCGGTSADCGRAEWGTHASTM